jgi:hypothetical protein
MFMFTFNFKIFKFNVFLLHVYIVKYTGDSLSVSSCDIFGAKIHPKNNNKIK